MTNLLNDLTVVQLKRALTIKQRIAELERELSSLVGESPRSNATGRVVRATRKRRRMSRASRAKIAAAARARWAKVRAAKAK